MRVHTININIIFNSHTLKLPVFAMKWVSENLELNGNHEIPIPLNFLIGYLVFISNHYENMPMQDIYNFLKL